MKAIRWVAIILFVVFAALLILIIAVNYLSADIHEGIETEGTRFIQISNGGYGDSAVLPPPTVGDPPPTEE